MSGKSSAVTEYSSGLTSALSTISDKTIPSDDRFKMLAAVLQSGANIMQEQHINTLTLQDKVETLELSVKQAEAKIQRFNDQEIKRLEEEIKKTLQKLEKKEKICSIASKIGMGACVINKLVMFPLMAIPVTVAVTVPTGILLGGFTLLTGCMKASADEKIWILKNYPKALHDDEIRKKASEEWQTKQEDKNHAEDMTRLARDRDDTDYSSW
ncbi:MAG: hypothetical protein K940chlam1_00657 [Candidatus Anoxychlamydiales bacterium]|nr:hypothetical protein [Candidatus Anoxychlamydiales bacterium]NGX36064.1 hypothetical protein [Candidatus Anoxychlamydiales bacterium]